jgi:hypothetical protein
MVMDISSGDAIEEKGFESGRSPYEIDESAFPTAAPLTEQFAFLLRYAILAPSSYNTQPWKFEVREDGIAVYADYTRRLPVADPGSRELLMGVGAAIFNLRVAASHFRFADRVDYNHSGDSERPIAFVSLVPGETTAVASSLDALFPFIPKRHTNRHAYLVTRIPEAVLKSMRSIAADAQVALHISAEGTLNQRVADIVGAADQIQQSNVTYRNERAEWVRPTWSRKADGMPGAALGIRGVPSVLAPWATKVLDLGKFRAGIDMNLCAQAPGLLVISGEDTVPQWLETGEVMQHLLLVITKEGLQYSFFNMPLEVPELRTRLRGILGLSSWPQLLLRIGYCLEPAVASPRRPVEAVLVKQPLVKPSLLHF